MVTFRVRNVFLRSSTLILFNIPKGYKNTWIETNRCAYIYKSKETLITVT